MAKRKNVQSGSKRQATPAKIPAQEKWSAAKHIAWWSILAMVFITPIAISNLSFLGIQIPLSYDQFDIIKVFFQRVLGLTALAAWVWDLMMRRGKIRHTPVEWLILAFLAWVTVSAVFSIHPPTAIFGKYRRFEGLLSFINYAVVYFITLQLADRPARIKQLAQSLFASGIVVCGYGLLQAFGKDILTWGQLPFEANRSFSTYGNPDLLGGFLMFGTFVSIGLALSESNLIKRGVYWFGFLLNASVVVTAFTRSAWVGSLVGFFFVVLFAIRQHTSWKLEDWAFSGVAVLAALGFIFRSLSNTNEVMNFAARWSSIFKFNEGSAKTRFEIWDAAISAIKDRPLFGFGADTFRLVFPKYKPVEYVFDAGYLSVADNVHNYPLQLAAGIGIPGTAMLYGICGWAAVRSFKTAWTRDESPNRLIMAGFWAACAAYITHLFFGLSVTGTSFLLWVSMGVLLAPTAKAIEFNPPKWGVAVAAVVTTLALFGIAYQFVFMSADKAYLMARIGTQGVERTQFAQKAVRLNPFNDMYRAEVGLALTDEALNAINATGSGEMDQQTAFTQASDAFKRAEASLRETIEFVPWEYDNYVFLSNLYNLGGQFFDPKYYQDALETAREGKKVEPFGPAVRFQLARALVATNQIDEAVDELEETYEMDPRYAEVGTALAELHVQNGDYEDALRVYKLLNQWASDKTGLEDKIKSLEETIAASGAATGTTAP